jgi:uncharacterized membrane protein YhaH (DUF805 family)
MNPTGNPYASPLSDLTPPRGGSDRTGPFDPKGRFTRLSWLAWNLVIGLVGTLVVLVLMAAGVAALPAADPQAGASVLMLAGMLIPQVVIVVLAWLLAIRRFHDLGASAWWTLTLLLPIGNLIAFLVLALKRGDAGPNRFGPPRPTPDWERVVGIIYIVLMVIGLLGGIAALLIPGLLEEQLQALPG